jgi:plastocyanin
VRRSLVGLFIAGTVFFAVAPAHALVGLAVPGSFQAGYATSQIVVPAGQSLTFANADVQSHDIVSDACAQRNSRGECIKRTFASRVIGAGETADVTGVSSLRAGAYQFFCSIHPSTMKGTLTVQ